MPALSVLFIEQLCISLGGQRILDGISLTVARGECVALLGESGSGKSMTACAALGLLPRHAVVSGSVRVDGTEVIHAPALSRPLEARPAMVMQDTLSALNPLATVGYQIEQPLRRRGMGRTDSRGEALRLLDRVGLPDPGQIARRISPELSGGQRQRVCIAIALACDAPVIIADEPTSALDMVTQAQILRVLREVTQAPGGPGLLFITHDLHAAAHLCDRALVIEAGRVVEEAPMPRLLTAPQHAHTRRLVASAASCGIACERLCA
ncbi:ATP-binding cassette domain-containing protein [Falsirhodobacter sp. 20TX0035]|uniref:ATP-binding cassette domain-containing protein n=1 Tax=Falsirhodobacter sp. 20TX0035 TaxID=3022019 RepID=UPI00232B0063|nr:ABC transporter ATP-binding protein [Falsirhodobacter sp. 20TX0035]MDB6452602.1 ABC transporter ATP-binding protein [Falsirhodobacter sp. 20TX0035]